MTRPAINNSAEVPERKGKQAIIIIHLMLFCNFDGHKNDSYYTFKINHLIRRRAELPAM